MQHKYIHEARGSAWLHRDWASAPPLRWKLPFREYLRELLFSELKVTCEHVIINAYVQLDLSTEVFSAAK